MNYVSQKRCMRKIAYGVFIFRRRRFRLLCLKNTTVFLSFCSFFLFSAFSFIQSIKPTFTIKNAINSSKNCRAFILSEAASRTDIARAGQKSESSQNHGKSVNLIARRSIEGNLNEALEEIFEYYTSELLSLSFEDEDEVDEDEPVTRRPDEKRTISSFRAS